MRQVRRYKNVIQAHHLEKVFNIVLPGHGVDFTKIPHYNPEFKESFDMSKALLSKLAKLPEVEIYLKTLLVILIYREKMFPEALAAIRSLLGKIAELNRRTLDPLNAYLYFYYGRIFEREGKFVDIREQLLDAYNKCCLKNDEIGQAILINLVLRNYMAYNNFEAAHNFIQTTDFPEQKSTNEYCKYLYYTAKVKAIRRDYQ